MKTLRERQKEANGTGVPILVGERIVIQHHTNMICGEITFYSELPSGEKSDLDCVSNNIASWKFLKSITEIAGRDVVFENVQTKKREPFVNSPAYIHRFGRK